MFEKRVLRKILVPRRGEATGTWRKVYNDEPHNMYC
jgi:hypothetical protein